MVWIYGGGFTGGSGGLAWYDGENLAAKGPVIVTFNYRLGALVSSRIRIWRRNPAGTHRATTA